MQPTEGETMAAMHAAARRKYEELRTLALANGVDPAEAPKWDALHRSIKNQFLDEVNSIVWAALQALPDRNQWVRDLLAAAPSPMQFITDVRRMLSGSPS